MKKSYKIIIFVFAALAISFNTLGQATMPTPQSVPYSQDFSSLTGTGTPAFPAGWQAWQVASAAPSSTGRTSVPTANKGIALGTAASTSSGAYDYTEKIGFLSVASSDVTLCLALNTTGKSNMKVAFDAMTIRNLWDGVSAVNYQNGLVLQYRVGTGATLFANLAYVPAEYLTGSTVQTTAVTTGLNPATGLYAYLPAACENQPEIQIRWIYRNVPGGTSGSRPSMALDNIAVVEVPVTFTAEWPKAENLTASGFTAKSNINTPGTTYFVVLASGATEPTAAQVKAGQDATGTSVAENQKGMISSAAGATEYVAAVSGLAGNTAYDVYFVAEGNSGMSLQSSALKVSVTTTASANAPTIVNPTATAITNLKADLGGEITSDGGSAITERGTVWKAAAGVTIDDNKLADASTATGAFSHERTDLPAKTKIYYKAYATNVINTSFTDESYFFTKATEPVVSVSSFAAAEVEGSSTSLLLSWVASTDADGYLILKRDGVTAPGTAPSDLTVYNLGVAIGTGTVAALVTPGSATSELITGLSPNSTYTFRIYPFGYDGENAATMNYAPLSVASTAAGTTPLGTGLPDNETAVRVTTSGKFLTVLDGAGKQLSIVSVTGQQMMNLKIDNSFASFNLQNGLYIVTVGNARFKVIIP
jgi:hypothetical protein